MANLNKENIIEVDVKNATVTTKGSMKFYVTDIKTCNIYCQLVTNKSETPQLIHDFAPVENAEDFRVTMRLIKPNNEPKELDFIELKDSDAYFYVDLTDEYKDQAGIYKCELFVDCTVSGELERITTSSFTYEVKKSIWSDLDDILEGKPGTPLLERLATMAYVDDSISAIPESDLLNDFAQVSYVNESIDRYDNKILKQDYASREYVNEMISNIRYDIGAAGYATSLSVNESISALRTDLVNNFAPLSYVNEKLIQMNTTLMYDYATKTYVDNSFNFVNNQLIDIKSKNYVEKETYDEDIDRVWDKADYALDLANECFDEIRDMPNYYATKTYVGEQIANAQLGGGEGGSVDLSVYATKEYVDNAVANIEIPEASGNDNCMLVIGDGSEQHFFSYDDIPDSMISEDPEIPTYLTVLLNNVVINYVDDGGRSDIKQYFSSIVTVIALREDGSKMIGIVELNTLECVLETEIFIMTPDVIMLAEKTVDKIATANNLNSFGLDGKYATKEDINTVASEMVRIYNDIFTGMGVELEKYAQKTYVQSCINDALGDIESLLKEI